MMNGCPKRIDLPDVQQQLEHLERLELAGADDVGPECVEAARAGPQAVLWRRFRDGTETEERLPRWLAELTLAAVPEWETEVERAKIVRETGK